jgi:hypothetical protein
VKPRFRFLNRQGEAVEVASLESLTELFESGKLGPDSVLHDALTGSWGPARMHPVCQLIFEEIGLDSGDEVTQEPASGNEKSATPGTDAPESRVAGPGPSAPGAGELTGPSPVAPGPEDALNEPPGQAALDAEMAAAPAPASEDLPAFQIVPEDEVQEDTVQAFLKARERERQEEELQSASDTGEVTLVNGDQDTLRVTPSDFTNLNESASARRRARGPSWPKSTDARSRLPRRSVTPADRAGGSRQLSLFMLLLAVGSWGIVDAWSTQPVMSQPVIVGARSGPAPVTPALRTGPLVPTDADARDAAFEDMVAGMEQLRERMRVGEPPAAWMSGHYMAEAAAYPEVASFWTRYGEFVDTLRVAEEELFHTAFRDRMREQGLRGSVLTVREARALQDFRADGARRSRYYDAMDELADASLSLHEFLRDRTGDIEYTPVDRGVADDPVLEIAPTDEATRDELWSRLDRVLVALDEVAGPDLDRRRDVTQRILGSLGTSGPSSEP